MKRKPPLVVGTDSVMSVLTKHPGRHRIQLEDSSTWDSLPLSEGPVVVIHNDNGEEAQLESFLGFLHSRGCEIHLMLATRVPYFGSGCIETGWLRHGLGPTGSFLLLDSCTLLLRHPCTVTIQQFFAAQAELLEQMLQDVLALLSLPRRSRLRKTFTGTLVWDGTWPSPRPAWQHLATLVRSQDGCRPYLAVIRGEEPPLRVVRLLERAGSHGILAHAIAQHGVTRVGAFFPYDRNKSWPI